MQLPLMSLLLRLLLMRLLSPPPAPPAWEMEEFGRLESSEKMVAILGDR